MLDPLVMNLRSIVRVNQYVTQDEYHFLTRFDKLLGRKPSEHAVIFHPLYGAGKLSDLIASYQVKGKREYPLQPSIIIRSEPGLVRPKGFVETTAEKFLISALQDDPLDNQFFYIILDADRYMGNEDFQVLLREFAFQSLEDLRCIKHLYLVTPTDETPPRLTRYVSKIIEPGFTPNEIKDFVTDVAGQLKVNPPENLDAYAGFTLYELSEVLSMCAIATKPQPMTTVPEAPGLYHEGVIAEYRKMKGLPPV